jgi:tRNA pseudouridine32 synthase / 23S rRNA pseudouridine746 synthase
VALGAGATLGGRRVSGFDPWLTPSLVQCPAGDYRDALDFFCAHFPRMSEATWAQRFARGMIRDEHGQALVSDAPYQAGQLLSYFREVADEAPIPFTETIVYEDEHIVVVDKPHFLPVTPSGAFVRETLLYRLKRRLNNTDLAPMHRLDKDTAGLIVFSKVPSQRAAFHALFASRAVYKVYEAIAPTLVTVNFPITLENHLTRSTEHYMQACIGTGAINAVTHIEWLESQGQWSRYRLTPLTGQRHQLRVQLLSLGAPIQHDTLYPEAQFTDPDFSKPLQLLAQTLAFKNPITGQEQSFQSQQKLSFAR